MEQGYKYLIEKEEMWAKVLTEVLTDNGIPYTTHPVYGAAFVLKTGTQERLQIFVPEEHLQRATTLAEELFSSKAEDSTDTEEDSATADEKPQNSTHYMPIFMCIGLSVGMAIGAGVGNIPVGMCIGLGVGVCLGSALDFGSKKPPVQ